MFSFKYLYENVEVLNVSWLRQYFEFNMWLFIITFTLITWYLVEKVKNDWKLPPGPWGIPILGCLYRMTGKAPHSWYLKQAAKYGDVTSLRLGSQLVVCIGSPVLLRELFNRPDSVGRPKTPLYNLLGGLGIISAEGKRWQGERQFLHERFRALGVQLQGNSSFERCILMEVEELMHTLADTHTPVDPVPVIGRSIHNVICRLMMSFRFEKNDAEFAAFNSRIAEGMKLYGSIHYAEYVKGYLNLPGKSAVISKIKNNLKKVCEFHGNHLINRLKTNKYGCDAPKDLLDCYVQQINKKQQNDEPDFDCQSEKQIVQVMNDLFSAGMETSRTTLVWCLLMMVREPEVASRVRRQLAKVVVPGSQVALKDRLRLPYVEAVIYETLRIVSVVPLGTTHVNQRPWSVRGFLIPEGSHIVPLINRINMDPAYFENPETFSPDRFVVNGKLFLPKHFIPFGVGRRVCLGEPLARIELFLFFANIMNRFLFTPENEQIPGLDGTLGVTHSPLPYKITFEKFNKSKT